MADMRAEVFFFLSALLPLPNTEGVWGWFFCSLLLSFGFWYLVVDHSDGGCVES